MRAAHFVCFVDTLGVAIIIIITTMDTWSDSILRVNYSRPHKGMNAYMPETCWKMNEFRSGNYYHRCASAFLVNVIKIPIFRIY